jgi:hypothetical protein
VQKPNTISYQFSLVLQLHQLTYAENQDVLVKMVVSLLPDGF